MAAQNWRFTDENSGDEGTEDGVDPDQMRYQRHSAHHDQNSGDHGHLADERIVGPADQTEHETPAKREADQEENARPEHTLSEGRRIGMAVQSQAGCDRDDRP